MNTLIGSYYIRAGPLKSWEESNMDFSAARVYTYSPFRQD